MYEGYDPDRVGGNTRGEGVWEWNRVLTSVWALVLFLFIELTRLYWICNHSGKFISKFCSINAGEVIVKLSYEFYLKHGVLLAPLILFLFCHEVSSRGGEQTHSFNYFPKFSEYLIFPGRGGGGRGGGGRGGGGRGGGARRGWVRGVGGGGGGRGGSSISYYGRTNNLGVIRSSSIALHGRDVSSVYPG